MHIVDVVKLLLKRHGEYRTVDGEVGVDVTKSFRDTRVHDGERDCERERWNDGDKLRSYMLLKELFIYRLVFFLFFFFFFL
jgi:hypothetical protein